MKAIIQPSSLTGTVLTPPSKSAMQRACAAALVRTGKSIIHNPGTSADDRAAISICEQLGATIIKEENKLVIESNGVDPKTSFIHAGESGLSARLFTAIAALSSRQIQITGEGSLLKRPFHFFDEVFPSLGVLCKTNHGLLPIQIQGHLTPVNIRIDGSLSSQFLTGLIMAFSASEAEDITIEVNDLKSRPYIDLTLDVLNKFKLRVPQNYNYESFFFGKSSKKFDGQINFTVEGDWSGAAFLLAAGAIGGEILVTGLDVFSAQADRSILQPVIQTGAGLSIEEKQVTVRPGKLQPFHFNATHCPDLFPPLAALAAYCNGTSVIEGVHRLVFKESNRAIALQMEMGKLGVEIIIQDDLMVIKGGNTVKGGIVNSQGDHRIAMACGILALKAENEVVIENAEVIDKSYPRFFNDLELLGASISLVNI